MIVKATEKCLARFLVKGSVVMSGEQVLKIHGVMPQFSRLHLGGIPIALARQSLIPQTVLGFVGCMTSFKVCNEHYGYFDNKKKKN